MDRTTPISLAGKASPLAQPVTVREGGAPLSVNRGKALGVAGENRDTPEGVRKAARQFESFFISYLFKVMKESVPDSPFSGGSSQASMYEDMFGAELGNSLAHQGGLGLADFLERNMLRSASAGPPDPFPGAGRKKATPIELSGDAVQKAMRSLKSRPITEGTAGSPGTEGASRTSSAGLRSSAFAADGSAAPADRTAVARPLRLPVISDSVGRALDEAAATAGVDPNLVRAVAMAESGGNPKAQSPKGAKGLMQLMAGTARELGVTKIFDPLENALGGARYLKRMLVRHGGDETLALASYNAGPGTVSRHGGVPPYRETRDYIERVLRFRDQLNAEGAAKPGDTES